MELNPEEQAILRGEQGHVLQKAMQCVVVYGETFGAQRLVNLDGPAHFVMSSGSSIGQPYLDMVKELVEAGIKTRLPFTANPRPFDAKRVKPGLLEGMLFRLMFGQQEPFEEQLVRLGLKSRSSFSCAAYLPEMGNQPKRGDILMWSESSAVAFANSVLGARTNRNSAGIDLLCAVLGKTPLFGLLTDEGRRATWMIELQTSTLPHPQLLGHLIGKRVVDAVPYISGLARFFEEGLEQPAMDYLKELGAAAAATGAVGLYHVEQLTPEAADLGRALLVQDPLTYVIDDAELEGARRSFPIAWKRADARPRRCLIGCPHLSLSQAQVWFRRILDELARLGRARVAVETWMSTAPGVVEKLESSGALEQLKAVGVHVMTGCPVAGMSNPLWARLPVVTNSCKMRTYSTARFFPDEELLGIIVSGALPGEPS